MFPCLGMYIKGRESGYFYSDNKIVLLDTLFFFKCLRPSYYLCSHNTLMQKIKTI